MVPVPGKIRVRCIVQKKCGILICLRKCRRQISASSFNDLRTESHNISRFTGFFFPAKNSRFRTKVIPQRTPAAP
jgi:hypothetical protein